MHALGPPKYSDKESIHKYWSEMVKMYTGIEVDENMEQGVYGTTFVTIMLLTGLIQFSYPYHPQYGGDAAWVNPLVDVILARGGEIRTCTPVKRVVIENGKVKGVIVVEDGEEKFVESDIVVVDVRPRIALKERLVTENELKAWDPATLESIKDIEKE
jgi:phytoene dehydrogenase-like protein